MGYKVFIKHAVLFFYFSSVDYSVYSMSSFTEGEIKFRCIEEEKKKIF